MTFGAGAGTTLLLQTLRPPDPSGFNLAVAPTPQGPFKPLGGSWSYQSINTSSNQPFDKAKGKYAECEDGFVWVNGRGEFHAVFHCYTNGGQPDMGGHAFSTDGHTWTYQAERPWDNVVQHLDGTNITYHQRQSPHLVLDDQGGVLALVTGVKVANVNRPYPWQQFCDGYWLCAPGCDQVVTHMQLTR